MRFAASATRFRPFFTLAMTSHRRNRRCLVGDSAIYLSNPGDRLLPTPQKHEDIMAKKTSPKGSTPKPKTAKQTKPADSVPSPKAKSRKPGTAKK